MAHKHAGAPGLLRRIAPSPMARHCIDPAPLQRIVMRHVLRLLSSERYPKVAMATLKTMNHSAPAEIT